VSLTRVILFPVQTWNLRDIETPGGSRSPVVVHSEDEARAVLIGLDPGQALGDHQVHEHSWVVVLDGRVQLESGGESVDAGPGYLAWIDAGERRSISTDDGARILLLLAPWPGEGHYRR
jgi:quercetin dioxygenase-like cupin family protein